MSQPPISPQQIEEVINKARQNPQSLVPHLQEQLGKFKNNSQIEMGPGFYYSTNEGKGAWEEAISFLQQQKSLPPMTLHPGLSKAAADHANDLASTGRMGHSGSDGSTMDGRIRKYCNYNNGSIGENVAQEFPYKGRNHALQTIVSLIIDDGVSNRGHRKSIFSNDYRYFGSASRRSSDHIITVIDYSSENLPERSGTSAPGVAGSNSADQELPGGRGGGGGGWSSGWQGSQGSNFGPPSAFFGGGGMSGVPGMSGMQGFSSNFSFGPQGGFSSSMSIGGSDFGNFPSFGNFSGQNQGGGKSGEPYPVSTNTSTQTQTVNGVTKRVTIKRIRYSDGSERTEQEESTT